MVFDNALWLFSMTTFTNLSHPAPSALFAQKDISVRPRSNIFCHAQKSGRATLMLSSSCTVLIASSLSLLQLPLLESGDS
jgi:hypothetical protein